MRLLKVIAQCGMVGTCTSCLYVVIRLQSLPALASLPVIELCVRMGSLDANLLTHISQGQDFQMEKKTSTLYPKPKLCLSIQLYQRAHSLGMIEYLGSSNK